MVDTKRGRPRKGSLVWRKSGWHARFWALVDGEWIRVVRPLGTDNKAVARRKLARLVAEANAGATPNARDASAAETLWDACTRIVKQQGEDGLKTWAERRSLLDRYTLDHVKQLAVGCL
jgi:hypothetical protein